MAELIHMRQRIKTVETIKKITHAMRLVSMSTHAKLGKQFHAINTYHNEITKILHLVQSICKKEEPLEQKRGGLHILIAIGAQKGLCGTFNSTITYELEQFCKKHDQSLKIIAIGKKMVDFVDSKLPALKIYTFPHLSPLQAGAIAQNISEKIFSKHHMISKLSLLCMAHKNFFVQAPQIHQMLPISVKNGNPAIVSSDYLCEANATEMLESLTRQQVTSFIHKALIESLLAEQAARFVSMDSSTRNAEKILEATKLKYNKLRQAKITKELLELADTF